MLKVTVFCYNDWLARHEPPNIILGQAWIPLPQLTHANAVQGAFDIYRVCVVLNRLAFFLTRNSKHFEKLHEDLQRQKFKLEFCSLQSLGVMSVAKWRSALDGGNPISGPKAP